MPKSSSSDLPIAVTRMFDGLRSRWTIRLACACTASQHLQEQLRTRAPGPPVLGAPNRDGTSVDVLQRQIGLPVRADAGVEQARDVRMLEAGEDVPLAGEPDGEVPPEPAHQRQLERDLPGERAVVSLGEPHVRHAAGADRPQETVRPHAVASLEAVLLAGRARRERRGRRAPEHVRPLARGMGLEQPDQGRHERGLRPGHFLEPRRPSVRSEESSAWSSRLERLCQVSGDRFIGPDC